jgi:hypothetical protein
MLTARQMRSVLIQLGISNAVALDDPVTEGAVWRLTEAINDRIAMAAVDAAFRQARKDQLLDTTELKRRMSTPAHPDGDAAKGVGHE